MLNQQFKPEELTDSIFTFEAGVNSGISPLLLAKNQWSDASNITVRGTLTTHRPAFRKITLTFATPAAGTNFQTGNFQGGCWFKPDAGSESLMAAIAGRLFQVTPDPNLPTATVTDQSIAGDLNPASASQAFLWQGEKWTIWNDGSSKAIFFDQTASPTSRRSNFNTPQNFASVTTADAIIPKVDGATTVTIGFAAVTSLKAGDIVVFAKFGQMVVQSVNVLNVTLINVNAQPVGATIPSGTVVTWTHIGRELPPGRMGAYGMGRNWVSLVDGRQFLASDIVGSSSGTQANNFRDSVLNITQNIYLLGGGNFITPGNNGAISTLIFQAILDTQFGQGPLEVFTPLVAFSCNAPVDNLTWQNLTNPILTETLKASGSVSQWAAVEANGDIIFRSLRGLESLILAHRDFQTWGNVPISREMDPIFSADNPNLLNFTSAVNFDNRYLVTASPVQHPQGVYSQKIVALNFDPVSSLSGKAPSVYDGQWTGLNVLQLISGLFNGIQRCFAFTLNVITSQVELYEILKSPDLSKSPILDPSLIYDNGVTPIVWGGESAVIDFNEKDPKTRRYKRLMDGEILVDNLIGTVNFQTFFKSDFFPVWTPWLAWSVCQASDSPISQPGFKPRMGLGEPTASACDASNNRPLREGYFFQFRIVIRGHCRFLGARFKCVTIPQEEFAPPLCDPLCP